MLHKTLRTIQLEAVAQRLMHFEGNRLMTAMSLDIAGRTLRYYIEEIRRDMPEVFKRCDEACPGMWRPKHQRSKK